MNKLQGFFTTTVFAVASIAIATSNAAADIQDNLIAHYPLSEGFGNTINPRVGSVTGTIKGATWGSGINGKALLLDSYDGQIRKQDHIEIPTFFGDPQNITISLWANLSNRDTHASELISLSDRVGIRLDDIDKGTYGFFHNGGAWINTWTASSQRYYSGTGWHHFVYVVDTANKTHALYVDGEVIGSNSGDTHASISYAGTPLTVIGRYGNLSSKITVGDGSTATYSNAFSTRDFTGAVGDIRIYDRPLSPNDVLELYRTTSGLVGQWNFTQTGTVPDKTGKGNNATAVNGPAVSSLRTVLKHNSDTATNNKWIQEGSGAALALNVNNENNQYAEINTLFDKPANVTLSVWANLQARGINGADVISIGDYAAIRLDGAISGGLTAFYHDGTNWRNTAAYGLNNEKLNYQGKGWHHFVYTVKAGEQRLYVDGTRVGSSTHSSPIRYTKVLGQKTFIGKHGNGSSNYNFKGLIGEVRVYNRPLAEVEVSQLYKSSPSYPEAIVNNPTTSPDWSAYNKSTPFETLVPLTEKPILTASSVKDVSAGFVADPFLYPKGSELHLFMEVLTRMSPGGKAPNGSYQSNRGDLALAKSTDGGITWAYDQMILNEPKCHLSYPYVFKYNDKYYMIPETNELKEIRLYEAKNYPYEWSYVATLIKGKAFVDASIFRYDNKWWIFTSAGSDKSDMYLFHSDNLSSGWQPHGGLNSTGIKIPGDWTKTRHGGRAFVHNGKVYRTVQNNIDPLTGQKQYGREVRLFEVLALSATTSYSEKEIDQGPILRANELVSDEIATVESNPWNQEGMHQFDPWCIGDKWISAVDGWNRRDPVTDTGYVFSIKIYSSQDSRCGVN